MVPRLINDDIDDFLINTLNEVIKANVNSEID